MELLDAPVAEDLDGIEFLWADGLGAAYSGFLPAAQGLEETQRVPVALAAALVECALARQELGGTAAAEPAPLLVADLCLARASRLLAESAPADVQIAFARVVEDAAALAAAGEGGFGVRERLLAVIEGRHR